LKEITRINHVGLRVKSLDIAREFYEKIGFQFIGGPMGPEPVAIVEHPSGVNINLILNASESEGHSNILMDESVKYPGFTHIALEITDVEAVKEQLASLEIDITETVEYEGATFFFVRDPDCNVIEFHYPAKQDA